MPPKKKQTQAHILADAAEAARRDLAAAKAKLMAERKRYGVTTEDIDKLEGDLKEKEDAVTQAEEDAIAAAIAQKKENEEALRQEGLAKIKAIRDRIAKNEEKAEKEESVFTNSSLANKAFASFAAKEAAKKVEAENRKARGQALLKAEQNARQTKKRIKNIAEKTHVKKGNIESLLRNLNNAEITLNSEEHSEEISHIITLAASAGVSVQDVLALIGSNYTYDSEEKAISFLKLLDALELDVESFLHEIDTKGLSFDELLELLEEIPKKGLSEAETAYVLYLAHRAGVPVYIAIELYHEEPVRDPFTMTKRIHLMRLSYLSSVSIHTLLTTNKPHWGNMSNVSNAENQLNQMKKNGKTFQQFLYNKREKEIRNMEEALLKRTKTAKRANNNNNKSKSKSKNKNTHTKKSGRTYASIAATAKRRIEEVEDTYTEIFVRNLPIADIAIRDPTKDLAGIIKKLKGCFGTNIFGRGKDMPKMNDLTVKIGLTTEKGEKVAYPDGNAFIAFPKHEHAKMVIDYMKNPDTKKPTFGPTGPIIKGSDVEPKYGKRLSKE